MTCFLLHNSGYCSVFVGAAGTDNELSCFKVYNKGYPLQPRHWLNISRECFILSRLNEDRVDGVVQLLSVADTAKHFSLQFKPCFGGTLYQCLVRRECCAEEELCAKAVTPLLHVLKSLHCRGIIHRDVKPENIFFEADGKLVLGDFGLAIDSTRDKPCSRVGTSGYLAPEVLAQPSADTVALRNIPTSMLTPYSTAVDIWAVGTLIHEALTGQVPFHHQDPAVVALKAQYAEADRLPACASPECQAFVDAALQKQAANRPSAAELLQHPWVLKHAGATSALVAARVKAKFLAELHMDRPAVATASCSAQGGSAAAAAVAGTIRAARAPAAGFAAAGGRQVQQPVSCRVGGCPADAVSGAGSSSQASTASSCSAKGAAAESCSEGSCCSQSGPLASTQAAAAHAARSTQQQQQPAVQRPANNSCSCKQRKVSFDCAALQADQQQQQQQGEGGRSVCMAALKAAAAGRSNPPHAQQQLRQHHHRVSSPGLTHAAGEDCSVRPDSSAAAGARSAADTAVGVVKPLHLAPALSEPMHVGDPLPCNSGAGDAAACCCCSSPTRTSQSGTCSAAVAADAAGRAHPHWRLAAASATAAAATGAGEKRCGQPCAGAVQCQACTDAAVLSAPVLSGPAHSEQAVGHPPRPAAGAAADSSSVRRVVQLGGSSTSALPAEHRGAAAGRAAGQQKPPLLKAGSAAVPVPSAAGTTSPKLPRLSPPKPGLILQRLRSLAAHSSRERGGEASSSNLHRRYSFDHASSPAAASGRPAAGAGQPHIGAAVDGSSPPRSRVGLSAAAGLYSPLAALSKLSGLLSQPSASVVAAAHGSSACCTAPGCHPPAEAGRRAGSSHAVQPTPAGSSEAGTAALLVGLAGPGCAGAKQQVECWAGQGGPASLNGCRGAKGVCMKVLNQVLRHQQHA